MRLRTCYVTSEDFLRNAPLLFFFLFSSDTQSSDLSPLLFDFSFCTVIPDVSASSSFFCRYLLKLLTLAPSQEQEKASVVCKKTGSLYYTFRTHRSVKIACQLVLSSRNLREILRRIVVLHQKRRKCAPVFTLLQVNQLLRSTDVVQRMMIH